jgi:hypothetical protein
MLEIFENKLNKESFCVDLDLINSLSRKLSRAKTKLNDKHLRF